MGLTPEAASLEYRSMDPGAAVCCLAHVGGELHAEGSGVVEQVSFDPRGR